MQIKFSKFPNIQNYSHEFNHAAILKEKKNVLYLQQEIAKMLYFLISVSLSIETTPSGQLINLFALFFTAAVYLFY